MKVCWSGQRIEMINMQSLITAIFPCRIPGVLDCLKEINYIFRF